MNLEPIDTSTTAGKARVMQLAAEGRKVVFKNSMEADQWKVPYGLSWDWGSYDYAIVANPVGPNEIWVTVSADGEVIGSHRSEPMWLPSDSRGRVSMAARYIRADLAGRDE